MSSHYWLLLWWRRLRLLFKASQSVQIHIGETNYLSAPLYSSAHVVVRVHTWFQWAGMPSTVTAWCLVISCFSEPFVGFNMYLVLFYFLFSLYLWDFIFTSSRSWTIKIYFKPTSQRRTSSNKSLYLPEKIECGHTGKDWTSATLIMLLSRNLTIIQLKD